jgi:hypothetical protein
MIAIRALWNYKCMWKLCDLEDMSNTHTVAHSYTQLHMPMDKQPVEGSTSWYKYSSWFVCAHVCTPVLEKIRILKWTSNLDAFTHMRNARKILA